MDITSFLMGICAVAVVVIITVVVVGMFKIVKLNRCVRNLEDSVGHTNKRINETQQESQRALDSRVDRLCSVLEKEDINLHQRIDNMFHRIEVQDGDLGKRIDTCEQEINKIQNNK